MDLKTELFGKLTDIPVSKGILDVYSAIPSNKDLISLKVRSKALEAAYNSALLTYADYKTELANLMHSLFFYIENLNEADLKKVFIQTVAASSDEVPTGDVSILFIAASPKDLDYLQITFEYAAIKNVLVSSINRDKFSFENPVLAATIESMVDAINILKPTIIHFSGHAGRRGVVLSDRDNKAELIPTAILDGYFETFDKGIDCVFLNACYSVEQAAVISKYSRYVIGMNCPIGDDTAITFSEAFYRCFFNDNKFDYEKAFKQARLKLQLRANAESSTPELWKNQENLIL